MKGGDGQMNHLTLLSLEAYVGRRAGAPLSARFLHLFITEYTNSEQNIDVCLYLLKQRIGKV